MIPITTPYTIPKNEIATAPTSHQTPLLASYLPSGTKLHQHFAHDFCVPNTFRGGILVH